MTEYFIRAASFAAPFVSDTSHAFQEGETPEAALEAFAKSYSHPAGLYSAMAYRSADAYHKGGSPLAQWLCKHEIAKQRATEGKTAYSCLGRGPGRFEIDGKLIVVDDPKGGRIVKE